MLLNPKYRVWVNSAYTQLCVCVCPLWRPLCVSSTGKLCLFLIFNATTWSSGCSPYYSSEEQKEHREVKTNQKMYLTIKERSRPPLSVRNQGWVMNEPAHLCWHCVLFLASCGLFTSSTDSCSLTKSQQKCFLLSDISSDCDGLLMWHPVSYSSP